MIDISLFKEKSEQIRISKNTIICQTHSKVSYLYILLSGELKYFHIDEVTEESVKLFCISRKGMILGWEVLNPPQRNIVNISVESETAILLKIKKDHFLDLLTPSILGDVCQEIQFLLETSFYKQADLIKAVVKQRAVKLENYFISQYSTLQERMLLLRGSPFFGEFKEEELAALAELMERREYDANEIIYEQYENSNGIFVLIQGEVSIRRQEGDVYLNVRSISTPGYIFGWSSTFGTPDIFRASTEHKTSVYFVSFEKIQPLILNSQFGIDFYKMVIWLLGNQLQLSNSRYTNLLDDHNLISVKHLIEANRPRIPLPSPLHQIPHLLADSTTQPLAFTLLHKLSNYGTKQERHLSSICLDLLKTEEREMLFMERIAEVYKVVSSGSSENALGNRIKCAEKLKDVFDHISIHIEGEEHLPREAGNIFIYNHLLNHPLYTLNNRFQLTLDSHFISSMILHKYYQDPGVRTVRFAKSSEYGHQDYYDNLGFINVYTRDSDLQSKKSKDEAKERFYAEANNYLKNGVSLIISPEGTSFTSEESPGPFKMGPFNIAERATKEPLMVPIVLFNFDKRVTENLLFCRILPPFKISEKKYPEETLKQFVGRYHKEFKKEVVKASADVERITIELNK